MFLQVCSVFLFILIIRADVEQKTENTFMRKLSNDLKKSQATGYIYQQYGDSPAQVIFLNQHTVLNDFKLKPNVHYTGLGAYKTNKNQSLHLPYVVPQQHKKRTFPYGFVAPSKYPEELLIKNYKPNIISTKQNTSHTSLNHRPTYEVIEPSSEIPQKRAHYTSAVKHVVPHTIKKMESSEETLEENDDDDDDDEKVDEDDEEEEEEEEDSDDDENENEHKNEYESFKSKHSKHKTDDENNSESEDNSDNHGSSSHETHAKGSHKDSESGFEKVGGSKFNKENRSNKGHKDKTGYKNYDSFSKGSKGHYDEDDHTEHYGSKKGKNAAKLNEAENHGEHHAMDKGEKSGKFDEKKSHKKGSKTTGYHNVFHKDEYKKVHTFYDDADHKGNFKKYGSDHQAHESDAGDYKNGGHSNSDHDEANHNKKAHTKKGYHDEADRRYKKRQHTDNHYSDEHNYLKKGNKMTKRRHEH